MSHKLVFKPYSTHFALEDIDIDTIRNRRDERTFKVASGVLFKSISRVGLLQHLVVAWIHDKPTLAVGFCRYEAIRRLKEEMPEVYALRFPEGVPCFVATDSLDIAVQLNVVENAIRTDVADSCISRYCHDQIVLGRSPQEISAEVNLPVLRVRRLIQIERHLIRTLKERFYVREIAFHQAYCFSLLDATEQATIAADLLRDPERRLGLPAEPRTKDILKPQHTPHKYVCHGLAHRCSELYVERMKKEYLPDTYGMEHLIAAFLCGVQVRSERFSEPVVVEKLANIRAKVVEIHEQVAEINKRSTSG